MLSSEGPVPVSATLNLLGGAWSCTFDQSLQPGPLNVPNWTLVASGSDFVPSTAVASGNIVSGASAMGSESARPDVIDWAPPPFDVVNAIGQSAAAFTGFPLIVT